MADGDRNARLASAAVVLGLGGASALEAASAATLATRTQRQLVEAARALGIEGVARLGKDALASRIAAAVAGAARGAAASTAAAGRDAATAPAGPATEGGDALRAEAAANLVGHKFEVGKPESDAAATPAQIPWGYGESRVTAMAVDPDRLYVYWELTDESIADARERLGRGGPGAWPSLRVYDTTGRLFDGTNAHGTLDHKVERGDRQWFHHVGRPASEAFVEIGLKSDEGFFAKVARSGRVSFPRRDAAPAAGPEWMTVRAAGHGVETTAAPPPPAAGSFAAGTGSPPSGQAPEHAPGHGHAASDLPSPAEIARLADAYIAGHAPWQEALAAGGGAWAEGKSVMESPVTEGSWHAGPFSTPVAVPGTVVETFLGPTRVMVLGDHTRVAYGPWEVVIRGAGAEQRRAVVARWEVVRWWTVDQGPEPGAVAWLRPPGSSDLVPVGASGRRLGASEMRMRGASELFFLGASERRWRGASELLLRGASERVRRGASERRLAGASESRLAAKAALPAGGSEHRLAAQAALAAAGASEQVLGGRKKRAAASRG